jgi:hypothetical protein
MHATVRFGIDGVWVGADNSSSYFAMPVDPGLHHLCASWQTVLRGAKSTTGVTSLTVEPDKVYYFEAKVTVTSEKTPVLFDVSPLDEDEGQFVLSHSRRSTWTAK